MKQFNFLNYIKDNPLLKEQEEKATDPKPITDKVEQALKTGKDVDYEVESVDGDSARIWVAISDGDVEYHLHLDTKYDDPGNREALLVPGDSINTVKISKRVGGTAGEDQEIYSGKDTSNIAGILNADGGKMIAEPLNAAIDKYREDYD